MNLAENRQRKRIRLSDYDYSQNGVYFITICTHNRELLFGNVGADSISALMITDIFNETINQYPNVHCPSYVIMPNHIHAVIVIENEMQQVRADMESAPTASLSDIVQSFKRHTTIEYIKMVKQGVLKPFNGKVWQRSFYDHVVRNYDDFLDICKYIDDNPRKWKEDELYRQ